MKHLCYRGVCYEYTHPLIQKHERSQFYQSNAIPQSVQVLRYRGVLHLRFARSATPKEPLDLPQPKSVRLSNSSNANSSNVSNGKFDMQSERIGSLYKLYWAGWRNGSTQSFSPLQHWILSAFFYYRRGFSEGAEWKQEQIRSELSQRKF